MNLVFRKSRVWPAMGMAVLLGLSSALGQEPDAAPEPTTPAAPEQAPAPPPEKQYLDEIVSVGGDAVVHANQQANGVVVVRGSATIEGDVDGDVVVVLGKLTVTGRVRGDVVVVMGEADINGRVSRDLALIVSRAGLGPAADLRGEVLAVGHAPEIHSAARLRHHPQIISLGALANYMDRGKDYLFQGVFLLRPFPPRLPWVWFFAGAFLVFHLAVAAIFAQPLRTCVDILRHQPARSFLIGLLACVLVAPLSLLLSFTVVATPLIWMAFAALCVFGRVAVYAATGNALGRAGNVTVIQHPVPAVLIGSILFYVSYMVPLIGFLVYWLVLPWGVGAALIQLFDALSRERKPTITRGITPPPSYGGLAAATSLTSGGPGPATHAIVSDPGSATTSAPPLETPYQPATPLPPPPIPVPPIVPLTGVELAAARRVGFWPRLAAALIDIVVISFVTAVLSSRIEVLWFLLAFYHFAMWTWKGTTLGGAILGLRLIRLDGRRVDWQTAIVRVLGCIVSLLPLGLGFIWVAWDDQFQSWHDRIAGTTIVKTDRRQPLV